MNYSFCYVTAEQNCSHKYIMLHTTFNVVYIYGVIGCLPHCPLFSHFFFKGVSWNAARGIKDVFIQEQGQQQAWIIPGISICVSENLFFNLWKDFRGIFTPLFHIQIAFLLFFFFFLWLTWGFKYSWTKGDKVRKRTCDKAAAGIQRKQGWIQASWTTCLHEGLVHPELPSYNHRILECLGWRGHLPHNNKTYSLHKPATRAVTNPPALAHPQQMSVMHRTGNFTVPDKCSSTAKTNTESLPEQQLN